MFIIWVWGRQLAYSQHKQEVTYAKHKGSDTAPPTPIDSVYEEFNTFNDLLGQKVTSSETSIVI